MVDVFAWFQIALAALFVLLLLALPFAPHRWLECVFGLGSTVPAGVNPSGEKQ